MNTFSAVEVRAVQSFLPLEFIQSKARRLSPRTWTKKRRRESPPGARRISVAEKSYGDAGVGAASMVLVVVDVVVVASGVPEGAGASWVLVVSVVVVVSFFWQPAVVTRIPAASREPRTKSFFMTSNFNPCGGAPRSSWPCCRRPTS